MRTLPRSSTTVKTRDSIHRTGINGFHNTPFVRTIIIIFKALKIVGVYLGTATVIGSLETQDVKGGLIWLPNGLEKKQRTWGQAGHHNNKKRVYKIKSSFIKKGNPGNPLRAFLMTI